MLLVPVLLAKVVHCATLVEVTATLDTSVILMEASTKIYSETLLKLSEI